MSAASPEKRREYKRRYYVKPENRARLYATNRRRQRVFQYLLRRQKRRPCTDCGVRYSTYVMDFDHLSLKAGEISDMVHRRVPWPRIMEEIAKCELVCANCHRERTHSRGLSVREFARMPTKH